MIFVKCATNRCESEKCENKPKRTLKCAKKKITLEEHTHVAYSTTILSRVGPKILSA